VMKSEAPGRDKRSRDGTGGPDAETASPHQTTNPHPHVRADGCQDTGNGQQDAAPHFLRSLLKLPRVVVWVAGPTGIQKPEYNRPLGWPDLTPDGNDERIRGFSRGKALCLNTGGVIAVIDVDPRKGGDIEKVRALLAGLGVRVFAEVATPSGGRHFYIAGQYALPSVHSTTKNNRLPGYPGVDVQSFGCNVFLPGTVRPKWDGRGYEIVSDDLDALAEGDAAGAQAFTQWVAEPRRPAVLRVPQGHPVDRQAARHPPAGLPECGSAQRRQRRGQRQPGRAQPGTVRRGDEMRLVHRGCGP
jgi:hypothetical protein